MVQVKFDNFSEGKHSASSFGGSEGSAAAGVPRRPADFSLRLGTVALLCPRICAAARLERHAVLPLLLCSQFLLASGVADFTSQLGGSCRTPEPNKNRRWTMSSVAAFVSLGQFFDQLPELDKRGSLPLPQPRPPQGPGRQRRRLSTRPRVAARQF